MAKMKKETIDVIGADANNLRDLDISFPVGELSMVVGVSGSGKTSLLLNILARQGGKRLKSFLGVSQDHLDPPMSLAFVGRIAYPAYWPACLPSLLTHDGWNLEQPPSPASAHLHQVVQPRFQT
ncbi:hypothetical protein EGU81_26405 [Pseudomonas syringae pv. theae]|nr:hypothetical protein [Pseudomonas syringae pv. theae]